jgi:hypothetical protein
MAQERIRDNPMKHRLATTGFGTLIAAAGILGLSAQQGKTDTTTMNALAERYVRAVVDP